MTGPAASLQQTLADQRKVINVAFGQEPKKGSLVMPLKADFTNQNPAPFNLQSEELNNYMPAVQGIFIDNADNPAQITFTFGATNQRIVIPPYSQALLPIFCASGNVTFSVSTMGTPVIPFALLGFPVAIDIWGASATPAGSLGRDFSSQAPADLANLQTTVAVNANRNFIHVQNQSAGDIMVKLDDGNDTAGTVSRIILATGGGIGLQGADWTSNTFKGRVRVYATGLNQQIMVHED